MKIVKKIMILSLFALTLSCVDPQAPQQGNPQASGLGSSIASSVSGAVIIDEVKKKIPKFAPYLIIDDFEICQPAEEGVECVLILSGKRRRVDNVFCGDGLVCMSRDSFLRLISAIEVYCETNVKVCREYAKNYKEIEGVFLVK